MSSNIPSAAQAVSLDTPGKIEIDPNVAAHLPPGSKLLAVKPHGASFWTQTSRITLSLHDTSTKTYFLKTGQGDLSHAMLLSEFSGTSAIHSLTPDFIPQPIAQGTYSSNPATHFYIAAFIPMTSSLPFTPPFREKFCALLAKLHKDSTARSPNGKFGFHIPTYSGTMPQDVTWCDTWEESFTRALRGFAEQERVVHGRSEVLEALYPALFDIVIPRLLRPLEAEGRTLQPVLIHGDLWHGNIATNTSTGQPITFDPAVFWAHNEYELNTFNVPRYKLGRDFMTEYHKHIPISAPEEDYEDRNRLYAIHTHFCASTLYPNIGEFRDMAVRDIRYLVDKYAGGGEEATR